MQPDRAQTAYLWDMLKAARIIQTIVADMTAAQFEQDVITHSAVIRQLEIIGEATKRLPNAFREAHSAVPWREIAGMRDFLIHAYNKVNLETVWDTATQSVPQLVAYIEPLLPPEQAEEE